MTKTIIYGPPGTGKTTKLLEILSKELMNYEAEEIAFVSFTKKGVNEGRNRAEDTLSLTTKQLVYFRTLHSMAFKITGMNRKDVLNYKDYKSFSKQMGMTFLGYYTEDLFHNDDKYLFFDTLRRNNPEQAEKVANELNVIDIENVSLNYKRFKHINKKYDFTDMIENYLKDGEVVPVKIAIIDEAQDLTTLQWRMIEKAFSGVDRMYIAGDDDQAIYEWSGSDINYFLNLEGDKIILDKSYRLPSNILNFAKQFTDRISKRIVKDYAPVEQGGQVLFYNSLKEIEYTKGQSWLLLARNNYHLLKYQSDLELRKAIFFVKGVSSINTKDLMQISCYERLRKERATEIVGKDKMLLRNCLRESIDIRNPWHLNFNWKEEKILYYQDIFSKGLMRERKFNININTIHGVKGGEADNVVLLLDITKAINDNLETNMDAELRCLYVACTRAKKNLHIVYAGGRYNYEKIVRKM